MKKEELPTDAEVAAEAAAMYPDTNAGPPSADDIAREAYAIYLHRGGHPGQDVDDWLEAERRLRERKPQGFGGSSARERDANRRAHGGDDLKA
jgi:hypothetical protein